MENLTIIDYSTWSGNLSDSSLSEDLISFAKRFMTASTDQLGSNLLELYVKSACACWYMKQRVNRTKSFTIHYDLLVLVICLHAAVSKSLDVCGLSCVWCCYLITLKLIKCNVWIGCSVLDFAAPILLAHALSYFKHLAFVVNILFVYSMFQFTVADFRALNLLVRICVIGGYFSGLYSLIMSPNVNESSLILMMAVPMMAMAWKSEWPINRANIVLLALCYCMAHQNIQSLLDESPYSLISI